MPKDRTKKRLLGTLPRRQVSELNPQNEVQKMLLQELKSILQYMSVDDVINIYSSLENRERDTGLNIDIQSRLVPKEELTMRRLNGEITVIPPEALSGLDRDVVEITGVIIQENGEVKPALFSRFFYQSSGSSRGTGLQGIWLPCGNFPCQEKLPSGIRYSKLEDEILENINGLLLSRDLIVPNTYQTRFSNFTNEFPTWNQMTTSIQTYKRFISEINAMISYKLKFLYTTNSGGVVASGIKNSKLSKKKNKKKKGSQKIKRQGKGKSNRKGKSRSKRKNN